MVPNTTNNTYLLEVDGQHCYVVGGSAVPANTWKWVDHQDTNAKIDLALTQGTHTVKFIGRQGGVKLDRIVATSDMQCIPVGNGNNCDVPLDATPPAVNITAPQADSTVSGATVAVSANASDNTGVTKVEFFVNSTLALSDPSAPYSYAWDTTKVQNGSQRLTVKAYDGAGNISSDTLLVNVQNGDTQAPAVPTAVTATATAYNNVQLTWKASTDNTAVTGYRVTRNGTVVAQLGAVTNYKDVTTAPATQYSYQVAALDAVGNASAASSAATVTTPPLSTADTQAPTTPEQLRASGVSSQQINLAWAPSTDNTGVTGYEVYRAGQKVATVTTTSFGDAGLQANTEYAYTVKARDAAGNISGSSTSVTAKTFEKKRRAHVSGKVTSTAGRPISGATVTIAVEGVKYNATTNGRGVYHIRQVPQGRYTVTFKAQGYASRTTSLSLKDRTLTLNAQLRKR